MTQERKVLVYGANGYTGKIIAESLAERGIPFYMAGRSRDKLAAAVKVVEERFGGNRHCRIPCFREMQLRQLGQLEMSPEVLRPDLTVGLPLSA